MSIAPYLLGESSTILNNYSYEACSAGFKEETYDKNHC